VNQTTATSTASGCLPTSQRVAEQGEVGLLGLDAIADTYRFIHGRLPSAWRQEIDLPPYNESF
jgi:hypothetical protein